MDLDDGWYFGGSADDVYRELRNEETRLELCTSSDSSEYNDYRPLLIDWIVSSAKSMENSNGKKFSCTASTVHLAIHLMDRYFARNTALREEFFLTAATSLVLAAKFEEKESHIPKLFIINRHMERVDQQKILKHKFNKREYDLLGLLDWRLMIPTPPLFIPYFLSVCDNRNYEEFVARNSRDAGSYTDIGFRRMTPVRNSSSGFGNGFQSVTPVTPGLARFDNFRGSILDGEALKEQIEKDAYLLLELTLKEVFFRYYRPSMIGSLCVSVALHINKLPRWSSGLTAVSMYTETSIDPGFQLLLRIYLEKRGWRKGTIHHFPTPSGSAVTPSLAADDDDDDIQIIGSRSPSPSKNEEEPEPEYFEPNYTESLFASHPQQVQVEEIVGTIPGLVSISERGHFIYTNAAIPEPATNQVEAMMRIEMAARRLGAAPSGTESSISAQYFQLRAIQTAPQQAQQTSYIFCQNPSASGFVEQPATSMVGYHPMLPIQHQMTGGGASAMLKWVVIDGQRRCFLIFPGTAANLPCPGQQTVSSVANTQSVDTVESQLARVESEESSVNTIQAISPGDARNQRIACKRALPMLSGASKKAKSN